LPIDFYPDLYVIEQQQQSLDIFIPMQMLTQHPQQTFGILQCTEQQPERLFGDEQFSEEQEECFQQLYNKYIINDKQ